ncbi:hypothetical protein T492DRAFT_1013466 [Pavlovales sp. CCMP2436]|nr:hypothetical protein T492DRAFT_1013466 [Pavlovales sp. CCMP2436]
MPCRTKVYSTASVVIAELPALRCLLALTTRWTARDCGRPLIHDLRFGHSLANTMTRPRTNL